MDSRHHCTSNTPSAKSMVPQDWFLRPEFWLCVFMMIFTIQCSKAVSTDPELVGTWETTAVLDGRQWTFTFEIKKKDSYRFTSVTTDGQFHALNGQWSLMSPTGFSDGGRYVFQNTDSVSITGKLGTAVWERVQAGEKLSGSSIDQALFGAWQTTVPIDGKQWTFTYSFVPGGSYELSAVTEDGVYEARNGQWKSVSSSGYTEEGQYTFLNSDSVSITGPKGTGVWARVTSAPGPSTNKEAIAAKDVWAPVTSDSGPSPKKEDIASKEAEMHFDKGTEYMIIEKWDKAIVEFNKAIELNPKLTGAYVMRGRAYHEKGQYNKAIADYTQALQLNPKADAAYYNRGLLFHKKQQYDKAIADYTQAINIKPKSANAYHNRGNVYFDKQQYDKAIADYDLAIKLIPKDAIPYYNRGGIHLKKKRYDNLDYS